MTEVTLKEWASKNQPEKDRIFLNAWERHIKFLNLKIANVLGLSPEDNVVIGEHDSKSIKHPVVKYTYKGVDIIYQYNIYNWQIMVKSPVSLNLRDLKYITLANYLYYQGIPEEYQFKMYDKHNKKHFAISLEDTFSDAYVLTVILRSAIDKRIR